MSLTDTVYAFGVAGKTEYIWTHYNLLRHSKITIKGHGHYSLSSKVILIPELDNQKNLTHSSCRNRLSNGEITGISIFWGFQVSKSPP